MKKLKFTLRFFNYNRMHNQFEYIVQCTNYNGAFNQPQMTPFTIGVSKDFSIFNKISNSLNSSSSVEYLVSSITDEKGRKSFESAFWKAIKEGFKNIDKACFDFKINQSLNDSSVFTFDECESIFTKYSKKVNGAPYSKTFSTDLGAVIAEAKFCWFNKLLDMGEGIEAATQLNVDQLYDEEDQKTLYYIEFDHNGHWYDATTWSSDDEAEAFFTVDYDKYIKCVDQLKTDIGMQFDPEWESIYTLDGEVVTRNEYLNQRNQEKDED